MAMNLKTLNGDVAPDMNTTPLIDVMLVLLVMLIVTLPIQTHAVKIDLPINAPPAPPAPIVTLEVDFDGTTLWDGRIVDPKTLDAYFADAARQNPQPEIHVVANRLVKYDAVAKLLANAQRHGVSRIGLGTEEYAQ
ncbi:MAG: biopolymer transporter ExbD [Proteobacteria bacterium]|nr:biopolymer transporter ExbD [Pseudomonadota bacterium]